MSSGKPSDEPVLREVTVEVVRPLRGEVLRAGLPPEASVMPDDDHPLARHAAVLVGDEPVSVGSVIPEAPPWSPAQPSSWRVRGMATREDARGHGLGSLVLGNLIEYATASDGRMIWCAARVGAVDFYRRAGFVTRGDRFVTDDVEHIDMWRDL